MSQQNKKTIYNCHTHIFTIDHVPNDFAKSLLPPLMAKILTINRVKWYYVNLTEEGSESTEKRRFKKFIHWKNKVYYDFIGVLKFTVVLWWIYWALTQVIRWIWKIILNLLQLEFIIDPEVKEVIGRYMTLARYSAKYKNQDSIFGFLKKNYPYNSRFVVLSMDMEYMEAGKPKISYLEQIEELLKIKSKKKEMYPFLFLDPRRIAATRENKNKKNFTNYAKSLLGKKKFNGIKLYPALGYYPFDKDLIDLYLFAQENQIPIMTHCIKGTVFYRGKKKTEWNKHPIIKYTPEGGGKEFLPLPQARNIEFTTNFTHPLNYHCLLDKEMLSAYLGREIDLSKLKICLAHFGGSEEWEQYRRDVWNNYNNNISPMDKATYDKVFKKRKNTLTHGSKRTIWWNASWLAVIYDLMITYENVYADVSFMLYNEELFPLLKYLLYDEKVKNKILFGTDFYVVSQKGTDKILYQNLRGYLGEELFLMIAHDNPERYLVTKFDPVKP